MTQPHQVAMLMPLAVSAIAVLCTIFIHVLALGATINFFAMREGEATLVQASGSILQSLCW